MKNTIQTKRTRTSGPSYRVLYAKTGRNRRLNAATATADAHVDLESDVANVGIGKALLVILVLHVFAIAAIYTHSKFFSGDASEGAAVAAVVPAEEVKNPVVQEPAPKPVPVAAAVAPTPEPEPEIDRSNSRYIVVTGDTYHRISTVRNVDESALRALNSNRPLRAGVVLDLPDVLSSRPVAITPTPRVAATPEPKPTMVPDVVVQAPERRHARAVEVAEDSAPKAVVVKPTIKRTEAVATLGDSGKRYKVQSGDTVWRIASRYKVSRADLLKINGLTDPRKLRVGVEIKIPKK